MSGFTYAQNGKTLEIKVDLAANQGKSASGKSTVIASSRGSIDIGDGVKLGLNVYRPSKK